MVKSDFTISNWCNMSGNTLSGKNNIQCGIALLQLGLPIISGNSSKLASAVTYKPNAMANKPTKNAD